jgi:hypothetical protein
MTSETIKGSDEESEIGRIKSADAKLTTGRRERRYAK